MKHISSREDPKWCSLEQWSNYNLNAGVRSGINQVRTKPCLTDTEQHPTSSVATNITMPQSQLSTLGSEALGSLHLNNNFTSLHEKLLQHLSNIQILIQRRHDRRSLEWF